MLHSAKPWLPAMQHALSRLCAMQHNIVNNICYWNQVRLHSAEFVGNSWRKKLRAMQHDSAQCCTARSQNCMTWSQLTNLRRCATAFKGTLTRDFRPLVFFHQTTPPRPLIHGLKPFSIWISIRRENRLCNRRSLVNPHFLCVKVIGIV
jgi:hypothetical protein